MSSPNKGRDTGAAALEFALILPLLLLILFLLVDFGRFFYVATSLNTASQEAARASSVGMTDADVTAHARDVFSPAGRVASASATPSVLSVSRTTCASTTTKRTSVTVGIRFVWITPVYLVERLGGAAGSRDRTMSVTGVRLCPG